MTIDIYVTPASAPSHAVLMTAKYLGINLNQISIDLLAGDQFKPEFLKINPQHTVPVINDEGFYLAESRAIQIYLVNKYDPNNKLYPKNPKERAVVDRMLFFDIGTLYKAELEYLFPLFENKPLDPAKDEIFKKALAIFEEFLGKTPYVAGDHVTLADLSILGSLTFAEAANYSFSDFPKTSQWMKKMKSEVPSYDIVDNSLAVLREHVMRKEK